MKLIDRDLCWRNVARRKNAITTWRCCAQAARTDRPDVVATVSISGIGVSHGLASQFDIGAGATFIMPQSEWLDLRVIGAAVTWQHFHSSFLDVNGEGSVSSHAFAYRVPVLNVGLHREAFEIVVGPEFVISQKFKSASFVLTNAEVRYRF